MTAAWLTPLHALTLAMPPDLVCCASEGCEATASAPACGLPEGWDGMWSRAAGWRFTCPACLDAIEEDWRAGRPSALGGGSASLLTRERDR